MIKLIGLRRALILAAILSVNMAIAAIFFFVITPMHSEAQSSLKSVNAAIIKKSKDIENIKKELQQYKGKFEQYQKLDRAGFFLPQDRFEAGRNLEDLKEKSGVLGYTYSIEAIKTMSSPDAAQADSTLINSRITLGEISAVLDRNVYALMYNLATVFPQHTRIQSFTLTRNKTVLDQNALQKISTGTQGLVEGKIVMDWLTVIPEEEDDKTSNSRGFRGR